MSVNLTLIITMIIFMMFVWFVMKFVWPPLLRAIDERRAKIAEGLAASDRAEQELEEARRQAEQQIREARDKAGEIVDQANQRHHQIVDQAKEDAIKEKQRQVAAAETEIAQSANQAREELRAKVAVLAVAGAEKLLGKEVDEKTHKQLLDQLIAEL